MYSMQAPAFGNNGLPYNAQAPSFPPVNPAAVPPVAQASQAMFQLMPQLQMKAIELIQSEAATNPLRTFFFNQMAANGFQNQDFANFMQKLGELTEMALVANPGAQVENVCLKVLDTYVKFKAVDNARIYPALAQLIGPGAVQRAQQIIEEFRIFAQQIEQGAMAASRQNSWGGMGQQMQPRSSSPGWADCANRPANFGQLNAQSNLHVPNWKREDQSVTTPAPQAFQPAEPFTPSWVKAPAAATTSASASAAIPLYPETKPAPAEKEKPDYQRSDEFPYDGVYNHNAFTKIYNRSDSGAIKPNLQSRMDREAHLGKPSFTPSWVKSPSVQEVQDRFKVAENSDEEGRAISFVADNDLVPADPSSSDAEQWTKTAGLLVSNKSTTRKIVCALHSGVVLQTIVSKRDLSNLIQKLQLSTTPEEAVDAFKAEEAQATDYEDLTAIREVVQRVTDRVNRYIKNEAALEYGIIDDYVADVLEQVQVLEDVYGAGAKKTYLANHTRLIAEAVLNVSGESKDDLDKNLYDDLPLGDKSFHYQHLIVNVGYAQIDLTSVELSFEFPIGSKVACGVFEQAAPILYNVVNGIFEQHVLKNSGCTRFLLRTSDGVTFELTRGAYNPMFKLISLTK